MVFLMKLDPEQFKREWMLASAQLLQAAERSLFRRSTMAWRILQVRSCTFEALVFNTRLLP